LPDGRLREATFHGPYGGATTRGNRQISDEAREAVVVTSRSHWEPHHTRKKMAGGMGLYTRREVLEQKKGFEEQWDES